VSAVGDDERLTDGRHGRRRVRVVTVGGRVAQVGRQAVEGDDGAALTMEERRVQL